MGKTELFEVQWQVGNNSSLDTTVEIKPWQPHLSDAEISEILLPGTMVNETYQATKRHPNSSENVIHDCTAGSPTRREPYGDGNSIVVGGVTCTQGGRESRPQGEGS